LVEKIPAESSAVESTKIRRNPGIFSKAGSCGQFTATPAFEEIPGFPCPAFSSKRGISCVQENGAKAGIQSLSAIMFFCTLIYLSNSGVPNRQQCEIKIVL